MEKEVKEYLKNKVKYDGYGTQIWTEDDEGGNQMVADVRGWGNIQNMFKNKKGDIDMDKAAKFQDAVGEFIVQAINEKLLNG